MARPQAPRHKARARARPSLHRLFQGIPPVARRAGTLGIRLAAPATAGNRAGHGIGPRLGGGHEGGHPGIALSLLPVRLVRLVATPGGPAVPGAMRGGDPGVPAGRHQPASRIPAMSWSRLLPCTVARYSFTGAARLSWMSSARRGL